MAHFNNEVIQDFIPECIIWHYNYSLDCLLIAANEFNSASTASILVLGPLGIAYTVDV